jgi:putative redox protein
VSELSLDLEWQGGGKWSGRSGQISLLLDADGREAPSPVQALAFGLAGCMAADLVHVLLKGRLPVKAIRAHLRGDRAEEDPRRFVKIDLHFVVTGEVPADRVERALALSRKTYCSVWHSMRQDIEFNTSFEVLKA